MQGAQIESSVLDALDRVNRRLNDFDVVVIIRGGGPRPIYPVSIPIFWLQPVRNFHCLSLPVSVTNVMILCSILWRIPG